MRKILVLLGPTGSGKTKLSLYFSRYLNCEIINADSRQIYKYLNIGTAKPTPEDRKIILHHFVDLIYPDEHFDAGLFGELGRSKVNEIFSKNTIPIVVGGSGLYIRGLVDGLFEGPNRNEEIRCNLEKRIENEGIEALINELKEIDPVTAANARSTKIRPIIRALEVYYLTGKPISQLHAENKIVLDFFPLFYGLKWDREILYKRVNKRSEEMVYSGLLEETCNLLSWGYSPYLKSLQTVGYHECLEYLAHKIDYEGMIDRIKQNTRHYIKRQLTWFNHDERIKWFKVRDETEFERIVKEIVEDFKKDNRKFIKNNPIRKI